MSFNPEKVRRYAVDLYGMMVSDRSYDQLLQLYREQTALLHDVSTDADPAGTVRELAVARETIKAQEVLIQELRAEVSKLKEERK